MSYTTYMWVARVLLLAVVSFFILAMTGVKPSLLEPVAPLALMYLFVGRRARQLRPDQPYADRV